MKKCLQCGAAFPDDYLFCLKDGADLIAAAADESQVQQPAGPSVATDPVPFRSPGTEPSVESPAVPSVPNDPAPFGSITAGSDLDSLWKNPQIIVPIGALLLVVIVVIAVARSGGNSETKTSSMSTPTPAANKARSAAYSNPTTAPDANANENANAVDASDSDYRIGRYATLDTNLRLRSASNKFASIVGVHYKGARIRVLETDEYDTPDGYSTWFRVDVVRDGCDAEGNLGCGHEGETSGWMNARYVTME